MNKYTILLFFHFPCSGINSVARNPDDKSLVCVDKLWRKREQRNRMRFDAAWFQKEQGVCLKKQIGKSTLRGQNEGIPGGGAYPFPGDLRAKFAWKEANRLSRGELIDNTAVTCSSLDRRPAVLPLSLLCRPRTLSLASPLSSVRFAAASLTSEKFTLSVSIGVRYLRSLSIPQSWIYPPNFEIRHIGYA